MRSILLLASLTVATFLIAASPSTILAAGATAVTMRVGYPQPSGAQLPLWVMGHLAAADRAKLLNTNVVKLYNLKVPASAVKGATNGEAVASHA